MPKIPTHLIIRYLANEATSAEQEDLFDWVSRDKQNQKAFEEFSKAWENKNYTPFTVNPDKRLKILNSRIDAFEKSRTRSTLPWMKIAASILLLLAAGAALLLALNYSRKVNTPLLTKEIASTGEIFTLRLSDGSTVKLNRAATLGYPKTFTGSTREVYLTGEAFFDVQKDTAHPFIIHTGALTTEVLGTSFNVNAGTSNVVVTVATGKVKVSDARQHVMLTPAEQVTYNRSNQAMALNNKADVEKELAWVTNTIIFDDHTLKAAMQMLEARFGVTVHFKNEAIQACVITGKFRNETLEHILKAIAFSTGITYEIKDKEVYLSGKSCQ